MTPPTTPTIAIACGGTGGHLFPGLAVAEQLQQRGCDVTLLISPKEVDQQAVKTALSRSRTAGPALRVATLPAVGLTRGRVVAFASGFAQSYRAAKKLFRDRPPQAALAMGGFTSAPPILAARRFGARTFLHESNTIPGRANRWLSWVVDEAFIGFPQAAARLQTRNVMVTGTPVRPQFQPRDAAACRIALGLEPDRPTLLVMGGSQGASGVNELVLGISVSLIERLMKVGQPPLQLIHLTGPRDVEKTRVFWSETLGLKAAVHAFFSEMELALGAATVAVSRAGASSLAELAAMRVPAVLIPYPSATDDHQFHNARAFVETGAARLVEQKGAPKDTSRALLRLVSELIEDADARQKMQLALAKWHAPRAAEQIAETILEALTRSADSHVRENRDQRETRGSGTAPRSETHAPGWSSALRFKF